MKRSDLEKIIHEIVREEVRTYVGILLPIVVNEVLDIKAAKSPKKITESAETDDWPTINNGKPITSTNLRELMGFEAPGRLGDPDAPKSFTTVTELGTAIEVPTESLPDHVVNALTRDYRGVMQELNNRKKGL